MGMSIDDVLMAHGVLGVGGPAKVIDALVRQYVVTAGETLNAGDLVEFINGSEVTKSRKKAVNGGVPELITSNSSYACNIACCQLDDDRIFVMWGNVNTGYTYARVYKIVGTDYQPGALLTLDSTYNTYDNPSCCSPSLNVVVTCRVQQNSSGGRLYGHAVDLLTINDTTITLVKTISVHSSPYNNVYEGKICALSATTCVIAFMTPQTGYTNQVHVSKLTVSSNNIVLNNTKENAMYVNHGVQEYWGIVRLTDTAFALYNAYPASGDNLARLQTHNVTTSVQSYTAQLMGVGACTLYSPTAPKPQFMKLKPNDNKFLFLYDKFARIVTVDLTTLTITASSEFSFTLTRGEAQALNTYGKFVTIYPNANNYAEAKVINFTDAGVFTDGTPVVLTTTYNGKQIYERTFMHLGYTDKLSAFFAQAPGGREKVYARDVIAQLFGALGNQIITGDIIPNNPKGIVSQSKVAGQQIDVMFKGIIATGLTNLQPQKTYYADENGNLTTTPTTYEMGVAISTTELLMRRAFWDTRDNFTLTDVKKSFYGTHTAGKVVGLKTDGAVGSLAAGLKPLGVSQATVANGAGSVVMKGVSKAHSGLTTGAKYYFDAVGNITTTAAGNTYLGVALSPTELLLPDYLIK
ncbi:hypothetical protein D478_26374 [Brevibacillus agri BAB-2500]|nr:hypothetical protein D478_26374 [Brevibacillus agri BAB-2500]